MTIPKSKHLVETEQLGRVAVKQVIPVIGKLGTIRIAPIETFGEWAMLIQLHESTTIDLPASSSHKPIGIVIGKSADSKLTIGQMVFLRDRSIVHTVKIDSEPYVNKKIIIMSERDFVSKLAPKFDIELVNVDIDPMKIEITK